MGAELQLGPVVIPLPSCLRSVFSASNTSSVHQMQPTTTNNILQQPLLASDMEPFTYRYFFSEDCVLASFLAALAGLNFQVQFSTPYSIRLKRAIKNEGWGIP